MADAEVPRTGKVPCAGPSAFPAECEPMAEPGEWNHNIHYHELVLSAVPAGARRGLDVGCDDGPLARKLHSVMPEICAIDADGPSIDAARRHDGGTGIEYVHADFLGHEFAPASFDLISSVAALHHMDAAAGLQRMRELLRPGGTLVVIGCARRGGLADVPAELGSIVLHQTLARRRTWAESAAPVKWPPPLTYAQMRRLSATVLPGCSFRRRLLSRYSLIWAKPAR